jgi:hypothetical protein
MLRTTAALAALCSCALVSAQDLAGIPNPFTENRLAGRSGINGGGAFAFLSRDATAAEYTIGNVPVGTVEYFKYQSFPVIGNVPVFNYILAGASGSGNAGDGQLANSSTVRLNLATWTTKDSMGNYYIVDWNNLRIRRIDAATNRISTFLTFPSGTNLANLAMDLETVSARRACSFVV